MNICTLTASFSSLFQRIGGNHPVANDSSFAASSANGPALSPPVAPNNPHVEPMFQHGSSTWLGTDKPNKSVDKAPINASPPEASLPDNASV